MATSHDTAGSKEQQEDSGHGHARRSSQGSLAARRASGRGPRGPYMSRLKFVFEQNVVLVRLLLLTKGAPVSYCAGIDKGIIKSRAPVCARGFYVYNCFCVVLAEQNLSSQVSGAIPEGQLRSNRRFAE